MLIIYRPIDQLKPDPSNPRRHSKKQIRQIADSIKTFGFNVPQFKDLSLLGLDFSTEVYLRYYVASATMACYIIPFICRERGVPIGADSDPTKLACSCRIPSNYGQSAWGPSPALIHTSCGIDGELLTDALQ
jgi:hypothetical protein